VCWGRMGYPGDEVCALVTISGTRKGRKPGGSPGTSSPVRDSLDWFNWGFLANDMFCSGEEKVANPLGQGQGEVRNSS
jgi:hypothetical protein